MNKLNLGKINKEDIACPHCGKKGSWRQDNPDRPFCSARCKLIDLGAWADESRRIPGESVPLPNAPNEDTEF